MFADTSSSESFFFASLCCSAEPVDKVQGILADIEFVGVRGYAERMRDYQRSRLAVADLIALLEEAPRNYRDIVNEIVDAAWAPGAPDIAGSVGQLLLHDGLHREDAREKIFQLFEKSTRGATLQTLARHLEGHSLTMGDVDRLLAIAPEIDRREGGINRFGPEAEIAILNLAANSGLPGVRARLERHAKENPESMRNLRRDWDGILL